MPIYVFIFWTVWRCFKYRGDGKKSWGLVPIQAYLSSLYTHIRVGVCTLTHDQMALYTRILYVYVLWGKVMMLYMHQPPDQLAYVYNFAHWGRDDMLGCPRRLDDIMYVYNYTWYDIYTHIHDTMNISWLLSYSDLPIESFTPCFFHVFYILLFMPYILSTL